MDNLVGRLVVVTGKVQGVFFRASTLAEAQKLELQGWVRNLPNGDVEMEVFGSAAKVEQLISWCRQGPPTAKVTLVRVEEINFREAPAFRIAY